MLLAVPIVLLMRLIRPFLLVRFGHLKSNRIGGFAWSSELYMCERDLSPNGRRTLDIFYLGSRVCNEQFGRMCRRVLHVYQFASILHRVNMSLPGHEPHVITVPSQRDTKGTAARTRPHLSFTDEEERKGRVEAERWGVPAGAKFICFLARDSAYLENALPRRQWQYHDYRDANIHSYIPAMEELANRGYIAIRMGAAVREALTTSNPKIFDYATRGRTDFLDVYLSAKCAFFVSSGTGLDELTRVFRRPLLFVNFVPLEYAHTWFPDGLFIPKKLWLTDERRFLRFREIIESGVGRVLKGEEYESHGIEVIENTPAEILAAVVEMDERLKGTWETTVEDEELQRRFWSLFEGSDLHGDIVSHIGAGYLRENRELLD